MTSTTDAAHGALGGTGGSTRRRTKKIPAQAGPVGSEGHEDSVLTGEDDARTDSAENFVAFEMCGEMYAFRMECVQEIIRMPELVKVPLGPPSLEGLANLRGRILPVVSLRSCCGLPGIDHDEATRVIVTEASGVTLGFVVDRVAAVTSAETADVESAETIQATVRSELLSAVVRGEEGAMTTVLDVRRLVDSEFAVLTRRAATSEGGPAGDTGVVSCRGLDEEETSDTVELVSFSVGGQEYALPIDRVREIVQVPERVTAVPNAERRVVGVMDLRGGLLPVISLRQIFGLPVTDLEPHNRIVVVSVHQNGRESLVGVVLDTVREVLRVPTHLVGDLPQVVSGGGRRTEVRSVCRLEEGARLVSVLSADTLVDLVDLAGVESDAGTEVAGGPRDPGDPQEQAQVQEEVTAVVDDGGRGDDELLVVFRLGDEEYCVDVDAVQEIIRVPETLVRVPRALDFVEGLVNLRGVVLPVVDLRTRLGLERLERDERQRIVVLIIDGVRTGFVVDSVAEVLKVGTADLEAAPELSEEQARLVTRVVNLATQKRMLLVLEPGQLLGAEQAALLSAELGTQDAA